MTVTRPAFRGLLGLLYLAAAVLVIDQLTILVTSILPFQAGAAHWRYGAVGLAAGRATPLLLADMMILGAAVLLEHRAFLRAWGILHLILAFLVLGVIAGFALDAIQVRQLLAPELRPGVILQAARAGLVLFAGACFAGWLGWRLWSGAREERQIPRDRSDSLVVGQPIDSRTAP